MVTPPTTLAKAILTARTAMNDARVTPYIGEASVEADEAGHMVSMLVQSLLAGDPLRAKDVAEAARWTARAWDAIAETIEQNY